MPGGLEFAKLGLSSATREAMRQAAKGGFKQFFKYMLGRTGKSVLEEMTTEGIQTVIEKMTANYAARGDTGFTQNKAEAAYKEKSDRINSDMLDELSSAGPEGYDQETIDRLSDEETQAREERDKELNSMPSMPTVDEKRKSDADYEKSLAADEDLESLINSLGEDDNYKSQNFGNGTIDINTLNSMAEDWNKRISSESGISIEVYESPEAYNEKNGLTGNNAVPESAEGFNEYGKVVLFASNIRSEEHARRKLMHEVIGHSGIKRLLGGNYKYALAGLVDLAKRDKHVRQIFKMVANRYKGLIRNVDRGNIFGTDQERAKSKKDYIFEEVGAFLSEEHKNSGGPVRRFLDRIKLGVRDRLRNWGFNVASSDLELSRLFESGKDAVAKGNSWENAEYNNVDDFGRRMSLDDGTKIIRTHKKQKPKTQVEPNPENRPSKHRDLKIS